MTVRAETVESVADILQRLRAIPIQKDRLGDAKTFYDDQIFMHPLVHPIITFDANGKPYAPADTSGNLKTADSLMPANNANLARLLTSQPLAQEADGTPAVPITDWKPIRPVTITAGAAGQIVAAEIVPAPAAGRKLDLALFWTVRIIAGAAQYSHKFCQDTAGGKTATVPDWNTAPVVIPHGANEKYPANMYGIRIMTATAALNFGVNDQGAGVWPNNAPITFDGFSREVL